MMENEAEPVTSCARSDLTPQRVARKGAVGIVYMEFDPENVAGLQRRAPRIAGDLNRIQH